MSFLTITLAFAATRALLAVQYLVVVISGRRVKRRMSAPKAAVLGLAMSCAFAVVAAALNASSRRRAHIKVILFYIGVGIDTITALWQYSDSGPVPAVEIAERYGAFSLIIMYVESLGPKLTRQRRRFRRAQRNIQQGHRRDRSQRQRHLPPSLPWYVRAKGKADPSHHRHHQPLELPVLQLQCWGSDQPQENICMGAPPLPAPPVHDAPHRGHGRECMPAGPC